MKLTRLFLKGAGIILALFIAIVAAATVYFVNFDWNRARPLIGEKVSAAIGRPFAIEGDLTLGWRRPLAEETGWRTWIPWPRLTATRITVGNPAWAKDPHFATLERIDFEVAVLPLLAHDIVIPAIHLANPAVDLERMRDGRNNWTFALPESK